MATDIAVDIPSAAALQVPPQRAQAVSSVRLHLTTAAIAALLHACGWLFPGAWEAVWVGQAATIALGAMCRPRAAFGYGFVLGGIAISLSFYWGAWTLRFIFDTMPWV